MGNAALIIIIWVSFLFCLLLQVGFTHCYEGTDLNIIKLLRQELSDHYQQNISSSTWETQYSGNYDSTVYIGQQEGLKELDKVSSLPGQPGGVNFDQYSGYVTVDPESGRALFYYFVESLHHSSTKPLVLWLNGGNAYIDFETSLKGGVDFYWTHALISDEMYSGIASNCDSSTLNFSSKICLEFVDKVNDVTGNIYAYDIYAPLCNSSSSSKSTKQVSVFDPCSKDYLHSYLNIPQVQRALHANVTALPYPWKSCRQCYCTIYLSFLTSCKGNQIENLNKLIKSRKSSNPPRPESWAQAQVDGLEDSHNSPVYVGSQKGLMQADKITALPGQPEGVNFDQYAGYVTIDPVANRALFYYFVESPENSAKKPLLLWLNGGADQSKCDKYQSDTFVEMGSIDLYGIFSPHCDLKSNSSVNIKNYDPCGEYHVDAYLNLAKVQAALHVKPTNWSGCG
ncbi:Peptidase S10, serine carboxypeptidase [Corchorus olitorius]|uniref:Peptidase S10, serine carboxypeptidase n=1 Tax=Corchorus olitorius TaxID=93759 RepID=A0A1R3HX06_9ROSI|nr:Peptidase S10, serine carboxypeptidase [Corchorus olitorius]